MSLVLEQKYVKFARDLHYSNFWILGEAGSDSYLGSQCPGKSGLEKDLKGGWIVKHVWEDQHYIVFLLERAK